MDNNHYGVYLNHARFHPFKLGKRTKRELNSGKMTNY